MPLELSYDLEKAANGKRSSESSLREQTQVMLREAILDGRFRAGQKLIERELCEMTGASRSILREALSHLEAKGLVIRQTFRGFTVASVSVGSVYEIFELRASVETLAAELFADRASDQERAEIGEALDMMEAGIAAADILKIRAAKDNFYMVLFTGCRNSEIRRALENVMDRISYLRSQLMSDPKRRQASLIEMRNLTRALQDRDRIAARAASLVHLESARNAVLNQMK